MKVNQQRLHLHPKKNFPIFLKQTSQFKSCRDTITIVPLKMILPFLSSAQVQRVNKSSNRPFFLAFTHICLCYVTKNKMILTLFLLIVWQINCLAITTIELHKNPFKHKQWLITYWYSLLYSKSSILWVNLLFYEFSLFDRQEK